MRLASDRWSGRRFARPADAAGVARAVAQRRSGRDARRRVRIRARRGLRFVLAAFRVAYCGAYDLEDPEVLSELAEAVGVPREGCLRAAGVEPWRDEALSATARGLERRGVRRLPAFGLAGELFQGEPALAGAAASLRHARHPVLAHPA